MSGIHLLTQCTWQENDFSYFPDYKALICISESKVMRVKFRLAYGSCANNKR